MAYGNDVFKEQLIAKETTAIDIIKKVGVILIGIVLILVLSQISFIANLGVMPFIIVAVGWGVIILVRRFNVEYEYVFTNGELDIDKIYNKSKRKSGLSINVRKFDVLVNLNHPDAANELSRTNQTIDYSSGKLHENSFAAVYEDGGKRIRLLFDPNEMMLDAIKMYIPRKIKK